MSKNPPDKNRSAPKGKGVELAAKVNQRRNSSSRKRARRGILFKFDWKLRILFLASMVGALIFAVYGTWSSLYDLDELKNFPQRTPVYDFRGNQFSRLSGENRVIVSEEKVSPFFKKALLAREDTRFYKHFGVDPIGIARAVVRNLLKGRAKEGASTLTQQLARNSFSLGGKNLHRKILEAFVAVRIERRYSKKEILESYMNRIYFGSGFWGIETASQAYFGKPAAKLSLSESALLAGLIRSPQRFSPFRNLEGSIVQRDTVLERMHKLDYITLEQLADAKNSEVVLSTVRPPGAEQNYAMDLIEQELSFILDDDQLLEGGLKVFTSIDPDLQRVAQEALDAQLTKIEERPGFKHPKRSEFQPTKGGGTPYLQGAVIVFDNATGGIRAVVGGRDFNESRFNRAMLSPRQVGSTFKPFVYAAAYERGVVTPSSGVSDGPIRKGELKSARNWSPGNSDGTFGGVLPAEDGLIFSRNTMSARVGDMAGLGNVRKLGDRAGFGTLPDFASVYLGSFEATLKSVTSAYTVFPNGGTRRQPFVITEVQDAEGNVVYKASRVKTKVMEPRVAGMVDDGLRKALKKGTGAGANFQYAAAGKTGTTNDYRDAWFVGYTKSLTCGVWVGLDKPERIMTKGYGGTLALPIWCDVMNAAVEKKYEVDSGEAPQKARKVEEPLPNRVMNSFRHLFEKKK